MIRLRFSRGSSAAAALVRAWTWSWCAHVGIALDNGYVVDATPELGVALRQVEDDPTTRYFRVDAPFGPVIDRAFSQLGKPYDWVGALGLGLHRDWQHEGQWWCSEFAPWCFQPVRPLLRTEGRCRITPRDLLLSPHLELES